MRRAIQTPGLAVIVMGWECLEVDTKAGGKKPQWTITERVLTVADLEPKS